MQRHPRNASQIDVMIVGSEVQKIYVMAARIELGQLTATRRFVDQRTVAEDQMTT